MTFQPPTIFRLVVDHIGGERTTASVTSYSIAEGMLFWTLPDRRIVGINLSVVKYISVRPPPMPKGQS